jgi:hypothetical protein
MSDGRLASFRARDFTLAMVVVARVPGEKVMSYVFLPWRNSMDSDWGARDCWEREKGDHDENMAPAVMIWRAVEWGVKFQPKKFRNLSRYAQAFI